MAYSNSEFVGYKKLSPNNSGERNHIIDTITIHCIVGQCSVETIGNIFESKATKASCNYGIGYDGRIGLYCEEKNRSWCTSSSLNDNRAITIEVASGKINPYEVNDKAYKSLIKLLVDVCERNNIKKLLWKADKNLIGDISSQNMTVHRWFANKSCPGEWLYSRHYKIADEVNKLLLNKSDITKDLDDYLVKVNCDSLNIRSGPGTSCSITGKISDRGVYTITHKDSTEIWGKLKSGAGWINLRYTKVWG